jgi:hypothetical protein
MSDETMILITGQQLIMDMLLSTMPEVLRDKWSDAVNAHDQRVVELLMKSGYHSGKDQKEG